MMRPHDIATASVTLLRPPDRTRNLLDRAAPDTNIQISAASVAHAIGEIEG